MNRSLTNPQTSSVEPKPFLRWAGGKSWLVRSLEKIAANIKFENYHEPFIGGASMFLAMRPQNSAFLSDLNKELIDTYKVVKSDVEELIVELQSYKNTETFYYNIREQDFKNKVQQAAKFIYLNQTSFNGIYRVNLKGVYNVPYGYRKKRFLEPDNLRLVSKRLKKAKLFHGDFELVKPYIKKGDLIFLDPPYTVSHNLNGFIKYNQRLFSLEDQYRLSDLIDFVKKKAAFYILTNAAHKTICEIFDKKDKMIELNRANLIGGLNAKRGVTSEYIFTNLK